MYDRPNLPELIDAVRLHLETNVIPAVKSDPKLYFQTLVAINVLKIAQRETQLSWAHLRAEWDSLNALEAEDHHLPADPLDALTALDARNLILCEDIRQGLYDDRRDALFQHLIAVTCAQLEVANPKFLQTITAEDAQ